MRSFGEWMFDSLSAKPVRTVGTPRRRELGDERNRTAGADEERPDAQHLLECVEPELDGAGVGRDEPGWRGRPELDLDLGARGCGLAKQTLEGGRDDGRDPGPPTSRIDTFASASTAITVFCRIGEPPLMPCTSTDGSAQVRR